MAFASGTTTGTAGFISTFGTKGTEGGASGTGFIAPGGAAMAVGGFGGASGTITASLAIFCHG